MIAPIPKSRIGINFAILLFLSAGLNGCLGSSDRVDVDTEMVPIVLALDSNLESASGIFDDPLLSTLQSSPGFSVGTYPVDSEAAKIEALRFGHIDVALVDGATAWMGWKEYGLQVMAAEVDQQGRSHHNAHAWVRSTDPIAVAHLDGDQNTDPFELFEGRRPCFTGWPDSVGAMLPMGFLLGLGYANVMGDPNDVDSLSSTIQGFFEEDSMIPQPGTTYYGSEGSLKCLSEGQGDIAFLTDSAIEEICPDGDNGGKDWCLGTDDYVMLPTFGRSPSDAVLFNPDSLDEEVLALLSAVLESPVPNNPSSKDPSDPGTIPTYIITDSLQHLNGYSALVYNVPGMQSYFSEEESHSDLDIDEVRIGLPAHGFHEHQVPSITYLSESLEEKLNTNVSITYFHDVEDLIAAFEGLVFQTPKGEMEIRAEDHQTLQDMYHFEIEVEEREAIKMKGISREIKVFSVIERKRNAGNNKNEIKNFYFVKEKSIHKLKKHWSSGIGSFNKQHLLDHKSKRFKIEEDDIDKISIEAIRFKDLVDKYNINQIDKLLVDVEGSEFVILNDISNGNSSLFPEL